MFGSHDENARIRKYKAKRGLNAELKINTRYISTRIQSTLHISTFEWQYMYYEMDVGMWTIMFFFQLKRENDNLHSKFCELLQRAERSKIYTDKHLQEEHFQKVFNENIMTIVLNFILQFMINIRAEPINGMENEAKDSEFYKKFQ